tara:strand:- start:621 stop:833 length:213 start_codon:yes stop_codon:yes gene_type:complete
MNWLEDMLLELSEAMSGDDQRKSRQVRGHAARRADVFDEEYHSLQPKQDKFRRRRQEDVFDLEKVPTKRS